MQINSQVRTATILAFPTAAQRAALNLGNKAKFKAELVSLKRLADIDGWYHQAAIEDEAKKSRN